MRICRFVMCVANRLSVQTTVILRLETVEFVKLGCHVCNYF